MSCYHSRQSHTRAKLNAHGEAAYEWPANTRDEATHAMKQAYECYAIARGEATLERVRCKVLSVKLTSQWS